MLPAQVRQSIAVFRQTRPLYALHHGTRHWPSAADAADETAGNALQITDPLLIYQAKVARGELDEDPEQIKALVKLRNLSRRLQDYTPPAHLLGILRAAERTAADPNVSRKEKEATMTDSQTALIRYLSTQQTLADLDTPRGLLITGPPGTGKSMVLDIWFDSLPTRGKFRRHYHHLLLTIYRIIWVEAERRRQALRGGAPPTPLAQSEKELEWGQHASSGPRRTVLPDRGTGVVWKRGGEDGVRPDGKGSGWRRILTGMPFFRPDSLSSDGGNADAMTQDELLAREATTNLAAAAQTTLPLHAASKLFLDYGPVLLFDEVQLIDVASAGLLKRILEAYWLLGGVVVGSSNRLPEDLYNNGVQQQQLVEFFEALRNRCPVHEMKGERDFRRLPGALHFWNSFGKDAESAESAIPDASANLGSASASASTDGGQTLGNTTYFVNGQETAFQNALSRLVDGRSASHTTLKVYNRPVHVTTSYPPTPTQPSIAVFTFAGLCDSPLGPADYLTIVSHFEEIVIRDVPQLLLVNKNQARRWITFIDAAYESGSRLLVMAASKPDDLFFPEARHERRQGRPAPPSAQADPDDVVDMSARGARSPFLTPAAGQGYPEEAKLASERAAAAKQEQERRWQDELTSEQLIQSETLSEARQDVEEGFRPNISSYVELGSPSSASRTSVADKRRLEVEQRRQERERQRAKEETVVGFPDLAIFSGADERFSYARAVSRLHEMSSPIWKTRKRWTPLLESEMRLWGVGGEPTSEVGKSATATAAVQGSSATAHLSREANDAMANMGDFADEASYEASTFPSRTSSYADEPAPAYRPSGSGPVPHNLPSTSRFMEREVVQKGEGPPKISPVHVWGQAEWGPKAGRWGKGPDGLAVKEDQAQPNEEGEELRERRARLRRERKGQ